MQQLVYPNPNIACQPGWCLAYVQNAFNTPHLYPDATSQWNAAQFKHYDRPNGIAVPVYFAMDDVPEGHIAVFMPDGSVYSTTSPTLTTPTHHPSLDDLINAYKPFHPGFRYLGWSEDLGGIRIVKETGMLVTKDNLKYLYMGIYGQPSTITVSPTDPEIGKDYATTAERLLDYANKNGIAYWQVKPKLEKEIADLKKQISTQTTDTTAQDTNTKVTWLVSTIKKIFNIQ